MLGRSQVTYKVSDVEGRSVIARPAALIQHYVIYNIYHCKCNETIKKYFNVQSDAVYN